MQQDSPDASRIANVVLPAGTLVQVRSSGRADTLVAAEEEVVDTLVVVAVVVEGDTVVVEDRTVVDTLVAADMVTVVVVEHTSAVDMVVEGRLRSSLLKRTLLKGWKCFKKVSSTSKIFGITKDSLKSVKNCS